MYIHYIYISLSFSLSLYIYIERERNTCIYIYIYTHTWGTRITVCARKLFKRLPARSPAPPGGFRISPNSKRQTRIKHTKHNIEHIHKQIHTLETY